MLQDLQIRNYRVFKELAIDRLSNVNLIVGANNAGKTSLLEAIYLLTSHDKPLSLTSILQEHGEFLTDQELIRGRSNPAQIAPNRIDGYLVAQLFYGRKLSTNTSIQIQSLSAQNNLTISISNGNKSEIHHSKLVFQDGSTGSKEKPKKNTDPMAIENEVLLSTPLRWKELAQVGDTRFVSVNTTNYTELANLWDKLVLTPGEDKVIDALRIIEPGVERISFTGSRTSHSGILVRLKGEDTPVPLDSMGDGMRRILAMIVALVSVGQNALLVDEIDTGLYYAVLKDMWQVVIETATKQNAQVFATTHSWDCVKAFQQALSQSPYRDGGLLIRIDRNQAQTQATTYMVDELDIAIAQGIEVR